MRKVWKFNKESDVEIVPCCRAKQLREHIDAGKKLSMEDKVWLATQLRGNGFFKTAVPVLGWAFDFSDVVHPYYVDSWQCVVYAVDKTSLRRAIHISNNARIGQIKY